MLAEGVPGARVVIADCPSERYVPSLTRSKSLQQPNPGGTTCVVHLTPAEVRPYYDKLPYLSVELSRPILNISPVHVTLVTPH